MMYRHSVTVYDARRLRLKKTISDSVRLSRLGYPQYPGTQRGAPVEAAFSPDARYAYVSNYSMYGEGFGPEGHDECSPASGYDRSFVYRIPLDTLSIDRAYRVGAGAQGRGDDPGRPVRPGQQLVRLRPERHLHGARASGAERADRRRTRAGSSRRPPRTSRTSR